LSWIEKKKLVFPGNLSDDENEDLPLKSVYHHSYQDSESIISRKELSGILTKEIEDLPAIYKTLITLFHHESMTYEELSQVTGLPEGTVKSSLFRARKMLKEKLLSKYQKEAL
jgi:RNA polymerase sigma factor (sigma-70 family)